MPARAVTLTTVVRPPGAPPSAPGVSASVTVAASIAPIERTLDELAGVLAVIVAATTLLGGAIAWLVVGAGLRPLDEMASRIEAMDASHLARRLDATGAPSELVPLAAQLNALLERLEEAFERERTLSADIAHELRTPLAGMRAIVEVALARHRSEADYQAALREALDVASGLEDVVERLLVLSRLESGDARPERRSIPLGRRVEACAAGMSAAASRGVRFAVAIDPGLEVSVDPELLDLVLSNALGNAGAHALPNSVVDVEAGRSATGVRLSVANDAPDLPPHAAERVFDRFWRGDAARSETGLHCGLGLTMVRRAMRAQGGDATASVADGRFALHLDFMA